MAPPLKVLMLTKKLLVIDKITAHCPTEYICQALNQTVTIKWTWKTVTQTLKFMKATILFKFAHAFVFIGGVIYFASFNVLNRYLFCFTQFQRWQFLLLEFLENSWLSSLKFAFPKSKPCVFSRNLPLNLSYGSTSFTGPFLVVLLTLVDKSALSRILPHVSRNKWLPDWRPG